MGSSGQSTQTFRCLFPNLGTIQPFFLYFSIKCYNNVDFKCVINVYQQHIKWKDKDNMLFCLIWWAMNHMIIRVETTMIGWISFSIYMFVTCNMWVVNKMVNASKKKKKSLLFVCGRGLLKFEVVCESQWSTTQFQSKRTESS